MHDAIQQVRRFNRFFTKHVGALDGRFLGCHLTLAEGRVLFEIARIPDPIAVDIQAALGLDPGYASRMIARLEERGWITRVREAVDSRRRTLRLTQDGQAALDEMESRQRERVSDMLGRLSGSQRTELTAAMSVVEALLDPSANLPVRLRVFRAGDLALIAARQSVLYEEERGWGRGLETNEAETVAAFLRGFKPGREQCWVAELGAAMAGSVLLTDEGDGVARLRLLYVEPFARRRGIGDLLVTTCLGFARDLGYRAITLWTHSVLEEARRLYAAHGFAIVDVAVHSEFGVPVQGETWRLELH